MNELIDKYIINRKPRDCNWTDYVRGHFFNYKKYYYRATNT